MHYSIRKIQPVDNPRVKDIITTVMTDFGCVGCGYSINDPEVAAMSEHYLPPKAAFYVIEIDGVIFGCGGIARLEGGQSHVAEVRKMYFLPELRQLGAGSALMERCLKASVNMGYRYIYLETMENMTAARKLYRRFGFEDLKQALGDTGHGSCNSWMGMTLENA
ncbi:MAG: GNAT family N-acetyltransferase [Xanthomonadales bacterium]|nr:GNAT family N-acetyltransferase [Xanthomonadales bacterium]